MSGGVGKLEISGHISCSGRIYAAVLSFDESNRYMPY